MSGQAGFVAPAHWVEQGGPLGWSIWRVAETVSTNTDLVDAAAVGAPDRSVLVAGHQTGGRGRLGRRWDAPPGANLLVSFLFRDVPDEPADLTHAVGVAAVAAAGSAASVRAVLKWPNDVMLDDRKLAGILAQRAADGSIVVGLGLNVAWAPPEGAALGERTTPAVLLERIVTGLDALLGMPSERLHERYRSVLGTLGRAVRVELPNGELRGRAIDVQRDGRLLVLDECSITHRVDVGDIVHLRLDGG